MAIFNPDQNPTNPDFTSDSKGTAAKKSYGDLFGAATDTGVAAVQIADQNNLQNIQRQVNDGIDQVNNEWGTAASAFETEVTQGNRQPLPADLERYGKHLGDVRKAYLNGNLKDSNYQMRIDSISRQIRAKYPGYRQEIDGIISKTLGQSTANDLRRSLMAQWNEEANNATDDEKAFRSEVVAGAKAGVLPLDFYQREAAGNPYGKNATRAYMAAGYAQDANVDRIKKQYEVQDKASDASGKALAKVAQADIALTSQRVIGGAFSVGGMTMTQLQQKVNAGLVKPWSPEETAQITASFAQMSSSMESQLWSKVNDPYYNDLSPTQKKDLVAQGMAQMNVIKEQITNQQFGLLNFSKQINDTNTQDALRNWMTEGDPVVRTVKMLSQYSDGSDVLNSLLLTNPELSSKLNNALISLTTSEIMNPQKNSLKAVIGEAKDKQGGQLDPQVIKQTVKNAAQVLLKKDVSLELAQQSAKILFSEENQAFLGDFTQKSQTQLFDTLISPRMTERIQELAKSDPQIGVNYRNWVLNSFTSLFNQDIATINDINKFGDSLQIKWDGSKFKEEMNPQAGQRGSQKAMLPGGNLATMYDSWANSEARKPMNNLNKYVAQLKPIIEAEGGTVEEAMTALFERNGVGQGGNEGSLFTRLYKAMGSGSPANQTPNRGEAYKKAINGPTEELQEFDLDKAGSGKLGANSKLKEAIRKAEGTTNSYNTRYGGASDVELSLYDVGDVRDMAKIFGKKTGSSAIGAYQFMPDTIDRLVKLGVIDEADRFTPELQEKMADYLIAEATNGATSREDAGKRLAGIWASLPQSADNSSAHGGVGLNPSNARISWDEFMASF